MKRTAFEKFPAMTALAWVGYWLIWVLMFSNSQQVAGAVRTASVNVGLQVAIVYVNMLFLIPLFLEKRRYVLYGLLCFVMLVLFSKVQLTLVPADLKLALKRNIQYPRAFQFMRVYLFFMVVLIISTAWKFAVDRFKNLQTQSELSRRQMESELQFLKSQINPHFLFNTLNNIYTLAYLKEDNAAPMIMKLSELLRYMLYQCQEQWVPLPDEVAFLRNIIEMQKLKSDLFQQQISFEVTGVGAGHRIAPLLLLTFFENCFKHSDLDLNAHGCIRIRLDVDDPNKLYFYCFNTKRPAIPTANEHGGIGLANLKKRLDLTYPRRHTLEITDNADTFEIRLTLSL
ncbi:sensor histidine kinase [Dyadobacter sp. OTU695]|uniref:sensor histidine kinase n=1 Tax=Dyadobacter sp. OTU695 TaxID=3043860 RepID=UPI00313ECD80